MSTLKFDLAKEGLLCVLKPYQAEVMRLFWRTETPHDSRSVYNHLQTADVEGAKSRASVIKFLNHMVDEGFLDYEEKTTKGGHKRVYSLNNLSVNETHFKLHVMNRFHDGLRDLWMQENGEGGLDGKFIHIKDSDAE